ncbi:HPr(Ser) kinase/phosphatase [Mycoplasma sp. SG1]|uniref:HPr(Ser) kinase/phosphatase n=1 Tax=Mycoplasma sp. SG1 TaxID=2810348 RepID=UPI002024DA52|nr:HPr(Ser) kinase/phosphatase [Mycoplasma sp. SG1]URM53001.1 HPr(Ser) kinase/phosphatase [Mycoplasma sp. SG1]
MNKQDSKKLRKFFHLQDLVDNFKLTILSGHDKMMNKISSFGINRPGLELADYFASGRNKRVCLIGGKESSFLASLKPALRIERLTNLVNSLSSVLVMTSKFQFKKELTNICKKADFPLLETSLSSTEFFLDLVPWISKKLSKTIERHCSLMSVYGEGVLIEGPSGIGKSEICMTLLSRNHFFVGDDRIIIYRTSDELYGASAPLIKNLIEIRGIGLFDVEKVFGVYKVLDEIKISCIIKLYPKNQPGFSEPLRLNEKYKLVDLLGIKIPMISLSVLPGRSISQLIEAAVINLKIQKKGINFLEDLENRFLDFVKKDEKE